jgi:catechol 2,3-dioxygenase-like lactoylglutathione lyase family enzyme
MAEFRAPKDGIVLTHFIVSDDVDRSRRFYSEVLGGETVREGEPSFVALATSWIISNVGGRPTDDKPTVTLETPPDPDRVSSLLNIRVADIHQVYVDWSACGAQFLTPPQDPGARDPLLFPRSRWAPDRGRSDPRGLSVATDGVGNRADPAGFRIAALAVQPLRVLLSGGGGSRDAAGILPKEMALNQENVPPAVVPLLALADL